MPLTYNINSVLTIEDQNAHIDALTAEDLPTTTYDLAFFGVANFLGGTYIQNRSSVNDINSTLTIDEAALNNAHFFLVSEAGDYPDSANKSAYGNAVTTSGTIFGDSVVTDVKIANGNSVTISSIKSFGTKFIPMTNIRNGSGDSVVDSGVLQLTQSSVGDGLFQAVTAALFKKIGKNAALLNDTDLVGSLNEKFHEVLNNNMQENPKDYANSKFFKRYLESGRYADDDADDNTVVSYNLDDTVVNMFVTIEGQVNDTTNVPALSTNTDAINKIFGTTGTDHKISVSDGSIGKYSITAFISLRNDTRF